MQITVLGNNGPFPSAGGACSGYLLQGADTRVLLDCGNGVLGNLQNHIRLDELDAVVLSHLHSDHTSDLAVLKYAIQIKRKRGSLDRLLNLYAPPEPREEYARLDVKDAFLLQPVTGDLVLNFGDLRLTFAQMTHPVKSFAVAAESRGKRFVYSGDTSWNGNIVPFARECDLLMLDAGLLERDKTRGAPHLTAVECGIAGKEAKVKRLMLTHFWPEYDTDELLEEAAREFPAVEASRLHETYIL